jgi:hypothetical protein
MAVVAYTFNTVATETVSAITITTASTASVDMGAALAITMAATGGSGTIVFDLIAPDDTIYSVNASNVVSWADNNAQTAGDYVFTIRATDAVGTIAEKEITVTVNAVAAGIGEVTNLALASSTPTTLTVSYTDASGATFHQIMLDGDTGKVRTLNVSDTVGIAREGAQYSVQVRGADGSGNYGPWCTAVLMNAADLSSTGPSPVRTAIRAHKVTDAITPQFNLNYAASTYPYYYFGNSTGTLRNGTFQAGGWVKDHIEPLTNVGLKYYRTIPAGYSSATHLGSILARNLYSTYGLKMHTTLNYNTWETAGPAEVLADIRDSSKGNFASSIASVAGLNEPNGPSHYYPANTNWKEETIAHTLEMASSLQHPAFSNVEMHCYSPWGRRAMDELVAYTDTQGRTWQTHCASLVDKLNLHYYTGGRRPEICGAPTGLNENGTDLDEVTLDWTMTNYQQLAPTGTTLPFVMTEAGWGVLPADAGTQYVSLNTSRKYMQRLTFENLRRGIDTTVWFQFFQTDTTMSWQMVNYSISGGVCTFTRNNLYTTMLNTLTAFYDNGATARTFTPGTLAFTLGDATGSAGHYDQRIHHLLTQKSDGKYYLAVWYEKDSWDKPTKTETFGSRNIKLTLPSSMAVATNRPYTNTTFTSQGTVSSLDFTINDDVTVFRIG